MRPARLLPTIRSRCRRLMLRPLAATEVAHGAARGARRATPSDADIREAAAQAEGSIGRALALLEGAGAGAAPAGGRRSSTGCRRSIRARCMRWATRSAAPSRARSRPSSTPSTPGWRRARPRAAGEPRGWSRLARGLGQGQPARRATPTSTISTASRWCSRCSAGLRRRRERTLVATTAAKAPGWRALRLRQVPRALPRRRRDAPRRAPRTCRSRNRRRR